VVRVILRERSKKLGPLAPSAYGKRTVLAALAGRHSAAASHRVAEQVERRNSKPAALRGQIYPDTGRAAGKKKRILPRNAEVSDFD
jgi:hypothetical protein